MNIKKLTTTVLLATTTLSTLFFFNNCGDGFKKSGKMMHYDGSSTGTGSTVPGGVTNLVELATTQANNTTELNKSFTVPITIKRTGTFATKTIELKIASPEIDQVDVMDGFSATVTPSTLAPGVELAMVTVNIGTATPTLTAQHFHVEAWDGTLIEAELEVNLTVQPIVRFQIIGNAPGDASWASNGKTMAQLFVPNTRNIPFVHHPTGLQVIFENYASMPHIVHSGGAIPHGDIGNPLPASPDGGVTAGGRYMPNKITTAANDVNASVYTHDVGQDANTQRRLLFLKKP